jgi:hypothetical protein
LRELIIASRDDLPTFPADVFHAGPPVESPLEIAGRRLRDQAREIALERAHRALLSFRRSAPSSMEGFEIWGRVGRARTRSRPTNAQLRAEHGSIKTLGARPTLSWRGHRELDQFGASARADPDSAGCVGARADLDGERAHHADARVQQVPLCKTGKQLKAARTGAQ